MQKNVKRRLLSLLLVLVMVLSISNVAWAQQTDSSQAPFGVDVTADDLSTQAAQDVVNSLTETQLQAYNGVKSARELTGLVGFAGDYALGNDDTQVSIIVEFAHQPAATAQAEAAMERKAYLPINEARKMAEQDHIDFANDLQQLFGNPNARTTPLYNITATYTNALNGVAMKLPSSKVNEIAKFDSVHAIYPDTTVSIDPSESMLPVTVEGDNTGMLEGRTDMRANELHAQGISGAGVTVCIIDTGIDYNHPDFQGAFAKKSPRNNPADLLNGYFYGRNFVDDSEYPKYAANAPNDPMETCYDKWRATDYPETDARGSLYYNIHGTHVAGIIAARGTNNAGNSMSTSALGVAPAATIFSYRALGPYGMGSTSAILKAIDYVLIDNPDVVNMSLGSSTNDPSYPTSLAVNNVELSNPDIVFVVAAGNDGSNPFTVGSPAVAPTAITVANATSQSTRLAMIGSVNGITSEEGSTFNISMLLKDKQSTFEYDATTQTWKNTYADLKEYGTNHAYKLVSLPNLNNVNPGGFIGSGEANEFAAVGRDAIQGNIVVLLRGSVFLNTVKYAKQYGAGAILLIDRFGGTIVDDFQGEDNTYLPFFTMEGEKGARLYQNAMANGGLFNFSSFVNQSLPAYLNDTSSHGPVSSSFDIKPDITAHGTNVLSTIPYYMVKDATGNYGNASHDYSNAYQRLSGTSMASPHVAGAVALLKNYSKNKFGRAWDLVQIKARLMNTAVPLNDLNGNSYGVYEIGAGYINVASAAAVDSFVTTYNDHVATQTETKRKQEVASFSFGAVGVNSTTAAYVKTLQAKIYNASSSEKVFNVSSVFNTKGQGVKDAAHANVTLTINSPQITVAAAPSVGRTSSETFSATITVPPGLTDEDKGSYEGYVLVTNANDPSEVYRLPFAIFVLNVTTVLEEGNYFFNRPVISTGDDKQNSNSSTADFYFKQSQPASYNFIVFDADHYDPDNWFNGAMLGELNGINALGVNTDQWSFRRSVVNGSYHSYVYEGNTIKDWGPWIPFENNKHYKIVIQAFTVEQVQYNYETDLYVDNDKPTITINDLKGQGSYPSLPIQSGATSTTITGNVFDKGTEDLGKKNVSFKIWESVDDLYGTVDQRMNGVFAKVGDTYYKALVEANGDYSVSVPISPTEQHTHVTLYAIDGFSIRSFDKVTAELSTTFDPDLPSLKESIGGITYAWVGSNKNVTDFYIEQSGAQIMVSQPSLTMLVGENHDVKGLLNQDAAILADKVSYFESSNTNVVTVVNNGDTATLTALAPGTSTITVHSKQGLVSTCLVTVPIPVSDGVKINKGDYVYYGTIKHAQDAKNNITAANLNGSQLPTVTRDSFLSPILWQVMGDEKTKGVSDGYVSLFSKYVLDAFLMNAGVSSQYTYPYAVTMRLYLNGGTYSDPSSPRITSYNSKFTPGFTAAELGTIPAIRNEVPIFDASNGELLSSSSYVSNGDKFYLPWYTERDVSITPYVVDYSVYWTAGNDLDEANSILFRNTNADSIRATFKNGTPANYWTETMVSDHTNTVIANIDSTMSKEMKFVKTVPIGGAMSNRSQGIRPATKLDPNSIVFAYEVNNSQAVGTAPQDATNYPTDNTAKYYKLTVVGSNGGLDVGSISGISNTEYSIAKNSDLTINSITTTGSFDIIAYKVVNKDGNIVKYGELDAASGSLAFDTKALGAGVYKVYAWPQKNNAINSNTSGVVSSFNLVVSNVLATGLQLNTNSATIVEDASTTLTAIMIPATIDFSELTWSSSDNAIATVEANGRVIGHAAGTATITAKTRDGSNLSATCQVVVLGAKTHVTSITLPSTLSAYVGASAVTLTPVILPANAELKSVLWSSSNVNVASVNANGVVTPLRVGTSTITATTVDGNFTASCVVTVMPILVTDTQLPQPTGGQFVSSTEKPVVEKPTTDTVTNTNTNTNIGTAPVDTIDTAKIDTTKDSTVVNAVVDGNSSYIELPATSLDQLEGANKKMVIEVKDSFASYLVPVNLASMIPNLDELLAKNKIDESQITFKLVMQNLSDNKATATNIKTDLPSAKVLGAPVSFEIEIINKDTGKKIGTANNFASAIERLIPLGLSAKEMPKSIGAFRYNEANKKFDFVPHTLVIKDGSVYVSIKSKTNSTYLVAENVVKFTDLKTGYWGIPYIEKAAAKGLVVGLSNGKFAPERSVTRAEFVQMIANSIQLPLISTTVKDYSDVNNKNNYYNAIMQAKTAGLLNSFTDNEFNPNAAITRQEMASILAAVVTYEKATLPTKKVNLQAKFIDYDTMDSNLISSIEIVNRFNIMQGVADNKFSPLGKSTRAQAATVLINLLTALKMID